jgi:hypothetical protein
MWIRLSKCLEECNRSARLVAFDKSFVEFVHVQFFPFFFFYFYDYIYFLIVILFYVALVQFDEVINIATYLM